MRKLRCSIILAVALSMPVAKCSTETEEEASARNALAEHYNLYGDFRLTYYIHSDIKNETTWIKEVREAANLINNYTCVTVQRTYNIREHDVLINGARSYYNVDEERPCTTYLPHPRRETANFRLDFQDRWDVLRVFLLCLAPFKDEFLRNDRDRYVIIDWQNIREGKHPRFFKSDDYPPDLPDFPDYCHGCVVNRPLTYLSKDGDWTIYPIRRQHLYKYKRWPVDLQRLILYYRQLQIKKTKVVKGWFWNSEKTYYGYKPGCIGNIIETWDD